MSLSTQKILELAPEGAAILNASVSSEYEAMYDIHSPIHSDSMYVIKPAIFFGEYTETIELKDFSDCMLILYMKENHPVALVPDCCVIIIYNKKQYLSLIDLLQKIFQRQFVTAQISARMLDIVRKSTSIEDLIEYVYSVVKNPIMLVDVTLQYITSKGDELVQDEFIWEYTLKNGFLPSEYIQAIFDRKKSQDNDPDEIVIQDASEVDYIHHNILNCKVLKKGSIIGYVKLLEITHPISQFDRDIFILFAKYLSVMVADSTLSNAQTIEERFVSSLLEENFNGELDLHMRVNSLGIKFYEYFHVITISRNDSSSLDDRFYYLLTRIRRFFRNHTVITKDHQFIVLYNTKDRKTGISIASDINFLNFLHEINCSAGISFGFRNLYEVQEHYKHSLFCIQYGNIFTTSSPVIKYEDIIEYHMLVAFGRDVTLEFMIHPIVHQLMRFDEKHDSNYLQTLFSYINHAQNLTTTAESMYIHYNTLRYRINRIIEITQIDFSDERIIFMITLSERILKILDAYNNR